MEDNEVFVVERLLDKRDREGQVEYLVKWKDHDHTNNTWETRDNLLHECHQLVTHFEQQLSKNLESDSDSDTIVECQQDEIIDIDAMESDKKVNEGGQDRGLEAEQILGATDVIEEILFLVKWLV